MFISKEICAVTRDFRLGFIVVVGDVNALLCMSGVLFSGVVTLIGVCPMVVVVVVVVWGVGKNVF